MKNEVMVEQKDKTSNNNQLLVSHNDLISARYKLTISETKMICLLFMSIGRYDEDFKPLRFKTSDLAKVFSLKNKNSYSDVKKLLNGLVTKGFYIGSTFTTWLSSVNYLDGEGIVDVRFDPALKPLLLDLQEDFTQLYKPYFWGLKKDHSFRIYSNLKKHQWRTDTLKIPLEDLKEMLGIPDKYKKYGNFKDKVLESAKEDINKHTDIVISYKGNRTKGRSIDEIEFKIIEEKDKRVEDIIDIRNIKVLKLKNKDVETYLNITQKQIEELEELADKHNEDLRYWIVYTEEKGTEVKRPYNYIKAIIEKEELADQISLSNFSVPEPDDEDVDSLLNAVSLKLKRADLIELFKMVNNDLTEMITILKRVESHNRLLPEDEKIQQPAKYIYKLIKNEY